MIVPGSNLLNLAHQLIGFQTAKLHRFASSVTGGDGVDVVTYQPPVTIEGSSQPVPRSMYEHLGLDLQKNYITFYTSTALGDLKRDKAPDAIDFAGRRYVVESNTDWRNQDGWAGSVCVDSGAAQS